MLIRNNAGEVIGERNTIFAEEGSVERTNTTQSIGCPTVQNITARDTQGDVRSTNVIGGKLCLSSDRKGPVPERGTENWQTQTIRLL